MSKFQNEFDRYARLNKMILDQPGVKQIDYSSIKIASMSDQGVKKLERVKKQIMANRAAIALVGAQNLDLDNDDKEALRNFYRQAGEAMAEVDEAIAEMVLYMYSQDQARSWLKCQAEFDEGHSYE